MKSFNFNTEVLNANMLLASISEISRELWDKGWSEKSASNFSLRLELINAPKAGNKAVNLNEETPEIAGQVFYITATGTRMCDIANTPLEHGIVIQITADGSGYYPIYPKDNSRQASSELLSHLLVHDLIAQRQGRQRVVLHTHATELIALTHYEEIRSVDDINKLLWSMQPGTAFFIPKGVGFVPYILPGTPDIARITRKSFDKHDIVVWQKHGAFAIGETLQEAYDGISIVCKSADIWLRCRAAGFEPTGLSAEEFEALRHVVK